MNNNYILVDSTSYEYEIDNRIVTSLQCVLRTPKGYKTYKLAKNAFEQIVRDKLIGKSIIPLFNEYSKVAFFKLT